MVRTRCYRDGQLYREGFPVEDVSEYLRDPANTLWFDLCPVSEQALAMVRDELSLHELAVEDVLDTGQRPKVDHYAEHLFIAAYSIEFDPSTDRLRWHEIGIFVTKQAVVTVRAEKGFDIDAVVRRWDNNPSIAASGPGFLLHGILDYIVDTHLDAVQTMDEELDELDDDLFDDSGWRPASEAARQRRMFDMRKSLVTLRRLVLPMREVVNTLMRRDVDIVDAQTMPYYQDVYDHVLRAAEWADSLRDLLANIVETRLTMRSNRLNVVMKQVTSWAAIIAVPTAVTSYYGQNIPFPGFGEPWGFWTSAMIMVTLGVVLYVAFRRKGWL
ncbi:MAG TPA: magnesium transporter CorA family protein [Micromonosporaceae bacterium]|nr:magnesium transporter CorA family protein [Micromonosporaceae bacterium]